MFEAHQSKHVTSFMKTLSSLRGNLESLNRQQSEFQQNKYLDSTSVQRLLHLIPEATQELLKSHPVEKLVNYHGGSSYSILRNDADLNPVIEAFGKMSNNYNAIWALKSIKLFLGLGVVSYHQKLVDEAKSMINGRIQQDRKALRETAEDIKALRITRSQVENGAGFNEGDFSFHPDAEMLSDHYQAMKALNLTEYFKKEPSKETGYMFSSDPELNTFGNSKVLQRGGQMLSLNDIYGHSGASFGWVCQQMHSIAKGWDEYVIACVRYRSQKLHELETAGVPGLLAQMDIQC